MRLRHVLAIALGCALGCSQQPTPPASPPAGGEPAPRSAAPSAPTCERPSLIVQITVDQLRGDLIGRYFERFGDGGFRRLARQGAWYQAAHYRHAITETAPGHATLATGADPRAHGIVSNQWYDPDSGETVYNTEDADSPLVGVDKSGGGRSPRNLRAPTVADQIVTAGGGQSRAYALSIKDRGAILPAGRLGKPFWFDKGTGRFVTSRFYADALPRWVADFNAAERYRRYAGTEWTLLGAPESYLFGKLDAQAHEGGGGGWKDHFPHAYGKVKDPEFFRRLAYSPAGDALLLDLVRALFAAEPLGQRAGQTDYLSISFSSTDYVGHLWGPSSLESEDNLRRLDTLLAALLDLLEREVGLERTLVVLSADHGVGEVPALRAQQGFATGSLTMASFDFEAVDAHVAAHGGGRARLYGRVQSPYVWLDPAAVQKAGLEAEQAGALLAAAFASLPEVRAAFTREQLTDDEPADDPLLERARRSYFPGRSGDLHLVPEPFTLLSLYENDESLTASHGTPWAYDTHVPILAFGAGVRPARIARAVGPHAIAPSLTSRAGAGWPAAAVGDVLEEVVSCR